MVRDNTPTRKMEAQLPPHLHKYVSQIANRMGRGFSVSALINQFNDKYFPKYADLYRNGELPAAVSKAREGLTEEPDLNFAAWIPQPMVEQMRALTGDEFETPEFHTHINQMMLLSVRDFQENGPLKGREF